MQYVIDARIFWNAMSEGPTGYVAYSHSGWGAEHGEEEKRKSWRKAMGRRAEIGGTRGRVHAGWQRGRGC